MKTITAILVLVWSVAALSQANPDQLFQEANQAYDQKDYSAAVDKYKTLLDSGAATASVYYNLGNAAFRLGNLGQAIWSYRKAQKLSPNDRDLKENLEFARLYRVDKLAKAGGFYLIKFFTITSNYLVFDPIPFFSIKIICFKILGTQYNNHIVFIHIFQTFSY